MFHLYKKFYRIYVFTLLSLFTFGSLSANPILPPALKPGDTIAIVAPASSPEEDFQAITKISKWLGDKGYRVLISQNLKSRYGYLAGKDEDRAKAFMDAWLNPDVKAVWCYRGGFGCTRILDRLDYKAIKSHPKILIGMSDITALHAAINKEAGLVTFLGPNVSAFVGKGEQEIAYNEKRLWEMISPALPNKLKGTIIPLPKSIPTKENKVLTIKHGVGKGRLTGGTLSLITSLIGTPWEINTRGKILVLEEVDEQPYRIDRMLCQLKQAGHLDHLAGVILCSWKACQAKKAPDKTLSLDFVFKEYFEGAKYPVLYGFPSGHITDQATLPLHSLVELDASKKTLRLLENSVESTL